jgi:hypothetical protein
MSTRPASLVMAHPVVEVIPAAATPAAADVTNKRFFGNAKEARASAGLFLAGAVPIPQTV